MHGRLARLLRTTAIYGLGGVLLRALGLILLPLFTSHLTPLDYGINAMLGWLTFVIWPLFSVGFGAALAPIYFAAPENARRGCIWTAATILSGSALLLSVLAPLLSGDLSAVILGGPEYTYLAILTLLSASLSIATIPFTLFLQFQERAKTYVVISTLVALMSTALSIWLVVRLGKGVQGLVEASALTQAVSFVMFGSTALSLLGKYNFDAELAKQLLKLGIPLIPSFLFLFVIQDGNKYILQWMAGVQNLGVYAVGFNLGFAMNLFVSAFQTAWLPYFMSYSDKREEAAILFGRVMTYYAFGFGALTLVFFIAAKPVVMLLTQPPYFEASEVVGLSAATQALFGAFYVLLPAIYFANHVRYVGLIQALAALVSVGVNLGLISLFGLAGAALALALGALALVLFTYVWNRIRDRNYLVVRYEWRRLGLFSAVFATYATIAMWHRTLSLGAEVLLSSALTISLPFLIYRLLMVDERKRIWSMARELVRVTSRTEGR